jgi:predicted membrane-bound spermidine synthase
MIDQPLTSPDCAKEPGSGFELRKGGTRRGDNMTALTGWENFYVIVGSSAGALIGLQFVVITLIAESPILRDAERAGSAFATPTIVHFEAVLLLSAVIIAPWHGIAAAAILWGVLGLVGAVYVVVVARRMQVQTAYSA